MYIKSIQVGNYKSFRKSEEIDFAPGVNLIVGVNNSGKTALLEAISLRFSNKPHVNESGHHAGDSYATLRFRILADEIKHFIAKSGQFIMPTAVEGNGALVARHLMTRALTDYLDVKLTSTPGYPDTKFTYPYKEGNISPQSNGGVEFPIPHDFTIGNYTERGGITPHPQEWIRSFIPRFFYFSGERMRLHSSPIAEGFSDLASNASNLAACMHRQYLNHEHLYRNEFMRLVTRVLPSVRYVSFSISQAESQNINLMIWPRDQSESKNSFPLSESGTGIGQVLAILYVIAYMDSSVVIIDEPNSFLHPAATRELLRIFKENTHHQYFISTHSSEVFAEVKPAHYISLSYDGSQSSAEIKAFGNLADTYSELGISPFFERALWVEGETEVLVFQKILGDTSMQIFKIGSASELGNRKKAELDRLVDVHRNMLAARNGEPAPSTMKIVVDGEHLKSTSREDYERHRDRIIYFLPRKMFENYLLDADAIASVLGRCAGVAITSTSIEEELLKSRGSKTLSDWLVEVDGSKLLARIFTELSGATCEYQKTSHSIELTNYILNTKPQHFDEIRALIRTAFHSE